MLQLTVKKIIVTIISYVLILSPIVKAEQSIPFDVLAPAISQTEYMDTVTEGSDHVITVNVTDNVSVIQVILYYRDIGSEKFRQLPMGSIKNTHDYHVNIAAKNIKNAGIEYYIKAIDSSENESFHGHNFSPLSVKLIPQIPVEPVISNGLASKTTIPDESSIFNNKWFWIGIGVLVLGAAAGGGGGGGAGATPSTGTLTVDAGELVIQ